MEHFERLTALCFCGQATIATLSRPGLWMAQGIILVLLSFGGLYALSPLHYRPPQPIYFLCLLLFMMFWCGWLTLVLSLVYYLFLKGSA